MIIKYFLLIPFCLIPLLYPRSVHRPHDETLPKITVHWRHHQRLPEQCYTLQESHLNQNMFIHFDKQFFFNHLLPQHAIPFRYQPNQQVSGAHLSHLIEEAVHEIQQLPRNVRPKTFKHFVILKMRDVDHRFHTGVYILKFKDYPFIVKLFIETPESFVKPTDKGFEPICFYYMAGMGRHIAGFTRIKNLEEIKQLIRHHPVWKDMIDFPRKWFWLPAKPQWITIHGDNIGPHNSVSMVIPAVYAVVCDEIMWSRSFSMGNREDKDIAIALSNYLNQRIDLHINNFGIEQGTGKLTLIDLEHFPSVVCISPDKTKCHGYFTWYSRLSCMMLKRMLFRNKEERRASQYKSYETPIALCA